jgi:signal transduction histidine kinase
LVEIAKVANRPIVVDAETFIGYGAIGGLVADPSRLGEDAANGTLRILGGESASQILILPNGNRMRPIFDWRQLQRWGVNESRLPPGSEIRFRELTEWERYHRQIIGIAGALLVQSALIVGLFYERRRRRLAEITSRQRLVELARINRRNMAGELTASIAHEIRQPLAGISANGSAALRWLRKATPDLGEAQESLERIVAAAHHASHAIEALRTMFKKHDQEKVPVNVNGLIEEVLAFVAGDLRRRGISVDTRLRTGLPEIMADHVQLQQVLLNLIANAVDVMASVTDRDRVLKVTSATQHPSSVLITIEDTGPGVGSKDIERSSNLFIRRNRMGRGWDCQFAVRLSRNTVDVCSRPQVARAGLQCRFHYRQAQQIEL